MIYNSSCNITKLTNTIHIRIDILYSNHNRVDDNDSTLKLYNGVYRSWVGLVVSTFFRFQIKIRFCSVFWWSISSPDLHGPTHGIKLASRLGSVRSNNVNFCLVRSRLKPAITSVWYGRQIILVQFGLNQYILVRSWTLGPSDCQFFFKQFM